jgi:hypothetical protein
VEALAAGRGEAEAWAVVVAAVPGAEARVWALEVNVYAPSAVPPFRTSRAFHALR